MKQPDFTIISKYVQETTAEPEDILYHLCSSILEERREVIDEFLPKVVADIVG